MAQGDRQVVTDYHARDVDDFLDEILPACVSDKRAQMLREAILDWAEELAYEHGEDRFECGKEAGEDAGHEHGYQDAVDEINMAAKEGDRVWDLRTMEAGLDARAIVLPPINWLAVDPNDVTLTMPEHEAYRVLRLLKASTKVSERKWSCDKCGNGRVGSTRATVYLFGGVTF